MCPHGNQTSRPRAPKNRPVQSSGIVSDVNGCSIETSKNLKYLLLIAIRHVQFLFILDLNLLPTNTYSSKSSFTSKKQFVLIEVEL